ncbi:hypothetical protein Hdeb2414_s0016g00488311 [Helianthus debilis subsp. tardiflorus]
MVKSAMAGYNTSMVAYAQMADSMDMGGHLYTYNEGITSMVSIFLCSNSKWLIGLVSNSIFSNMMHYSFVK